MHEDNFYQSISLTSHPCMRTSPKEGGREGTQQNCLVSLFTHSLSAHSNPHLPPLSFLQYSYTPLIHFTGGLPLTFHPLTLLSYSLFIDIYVHFHHMSTLSQYTDLYPFNHPTIHSHCCFTPIYVSLFSASHLNTPQEPYM